MPVSFAESTLKGLLVLTASAATNFYFENKKSILLLGLLHTFHKMYKCKSSLGTLWLLPEPLTGSQGQPTVCCAAGAAAAAASLQYISDTACTIIYISEK